MTHTCLLDTLLSYRPQGNIATLPINRLNLRAIMRKLFIITSLVFSCAPATADWFFQPKLGYSSLDYQLTLGQNYGDTATATIPTTTIGFSLVNSDGWYVDLDFTGGNDEVTNFFPETDYIENFNTTVSAGMSMGTGFTLFAGFNSQDTQIENHKEQTGQYKDFQFTTQGLFGGLAKTFSLTKTQSFNISGALGVMSGRYEALPENSANQIIEAEGDAIGYSVAAAYTYRITTKLPITAGLKAQSYTYTDMTDLNTDVLYADAEEELISVFIKAAYTF